MKGQRFLVSCLHCKRIIAMVGGVVDAERLHQVRAHLLACCPDAVEGSSPAIEATLRHFRAVPIDSDALPPDAA